MLRLLALLVAVIVFLPVDELLGFVIFKRGVNLALQPPMSRALPLIEAAHKDAKIPRGAVITSGTEGKHSKGSLHPVGLAVDLRTRDLTLTQRTVLVAKLKQRLNGHELKNRPYQVVVEGDHLHLEYQPRAA